mgnify:FL=1
MKKNVLHSLIFGVVLVITVGVGATMLYRSYQSNERYHQLQTSYKTIQSEISRNRKDNVTVVEQVEKNIQGVSNQQLKEDRKLASLYFSPAFTWRSGDEYDSIRKRYIDALGPDSQFVQNYLKENIRIDVANKNIKNNDIDIQGLRSNFEEIVLYPTTWKADGSITYVGVIKYYVYKNNNDLNDKSGLLKSKALVEFTVTGQNAKDRHVTNVTAYAGSLE